MRAIGSTPDDPYSLMYLTLISAIGNAEKQVYLTNAYFVPDPQLLKALIDAAGRGVDVRLILPSHSDSEVVFHAGRSHYSALLKAGVKIYERRGALLHSKTAIIDGVWSTRRIDQSGLAQLSRQRRDQRGDPGARIRPANAGHVRQRTSKLPRPSTWKAGNAGRWSGWGRTGAAAALALTGGSRMGRRTLATTDALRNLAPLTRSFSDLEFYRAELHAAWFPSCN